MTIPVCCLSASQADSFLGRLTMGNYWSVPASKKHINPILAQRLLETRKQAIIAKQATYLREYQSREHQFDSTRGVQLYALLRQSLAAEHDLSDEIIGLIESRSSDSTDLVARELSRNRAFANLARTINEADMVKLAHAHRVESSVGRKRCIIAAFRLRKDRAAVLDARITQLDTLIVQNQRINESTMIGNILRLMTLDRRDYQAAVVARADIEQQAEQVAEIMQAAHAVETIGSEPIVYSAETVSAALMSPEDVDNSLLVELELYANNDVCDSSPAAPAAPAATYNARVAVQA